MPRPKKKPVQQRRAEAPIPAYLVPAPSPPEAPPPTPPKPTHVVAAESPSKSVLFRAQREARKVVATKKKEALGFVADAERKWALQGRLFDAAMRRCERDKKRDWFSSWKTIQLATDKLKDARYYRLSAHFVAAQADIEVLHAQMAVRDAKITRLRRQLSVARRAKWKRRGWSTTRVRFSL